MNEKQLKYKTKWFNLLHTIYTIKHVYVDMICPWYGGMYQFILWALNRSRIWCVCAVCTRSVSRVMAISRWHAFDTEDIAWSLLQNLFLSMFWWVIRTAVGSAEQTAFSSSKCVSLRPSAPPHIRTRTCSN